MIKELGENQKEKKKVLSTRSGKGLLSAIIVKGMDTYQKTAQVPKNRKERPKEEEKAKEEKGNLEDHQPYRKGERVEKEREPGRRQDALPAVELTIKQIVQRTTQVKGEAKED